MFFFFEAKGEVSLDKRKNTKVNHNQRCENMFLCFVLLCEITIAELGQYYVLENIMIEKKKITFFKPNKTKFKYIRDHKKAPWVWEMYPERYIFHFEKEKKKGKSFYFF